MTDLLTVDIRDVAFEVNDRLKNLIQPEDDDDITTDAEDRVQGANSPRFSPRTTRKGAETPSAGVGGPAKTSPKLAPKLSPKVATKMPKPAQPSTTATGVAASSSDPTTNASMDAASSQTSQLSPKTGQSSPKTGQKEANVPTPKVITPIVSTETPKIRLLSVLGVLIPHMKYTQQETRMESLRWLMWLHQQLPKRVRRSKDTQSGQSVKFTFFFFTCIVE